MPVAKVWTLKNETVPKSAIVSIATSRTPPKAAVRAIGSATVRNARHGPRPSVRAAMNCAPLWLRNAARQRRYT